MKAVARLLVPFLGIVFSAVFTVIGLWPLIDDGGVRLWSLGLALVFAMITLVRSSALAPLNRVWTKIGLVLHHVVNPVIMALLFYLAGNFIHIFHAFNGIFAYSGFA